MFFQEQSDEGLIFPFDPEKSTYIRILRVHVKQVLFPRGRDKH